MSNIKMSTAAALIVLSKSAIDPEDMSDEELETAFREAKDAQDDGVEDTPEEEPNEELEQPDESDNSETPADVDSNLEDEPEDVEPITEDTPPAEEPEVESNITYEDEYFKVVDGHTQFQPIKINGQDIPVENMKELYALGSKGGHFTQSMQEIAPYRRSISAMKENDISEADINLLIEARKGNKDALSAIMQVGGIDPLDIEDTPSDGYAPKEYGQSTQQMAIADIQRELGQDPEFVTTQSIVDTQWDAKSRSTLAQDVNLIRGLHNDVKSGTYNIIAPQAAKLELMDGGNRSKLEYYMEAGQRYFAVQDAENQRREAPAQSVTNNNVNQKKSAGSPKGSTTRKPDVIDYLDMSDDEYDKMYKNIMDRV